MTPPGPGGAAGRALAIDLGVRYLGTSWWDGGRLVEAVRLDPGARSDGAARTLLARELADRLARYEVADAPLVQIVCETPQDYVARTSVRTALDRMRSTLDAVRAATGPRSRWTLVRPAEWKANVPKTVHHERARWLLRPDERDLVPWHDPDVADAVALGLWVLGRAGRGGARPGPGPTFGRRGPPDAS